MNTSTASNRSLYRRMFGYLRPYRGLAIAAFVVTLLFAAADALTFLAMAPAASVLFRENPQATTAVDTLATGPAADAAPSLLTNPLAIGGRIGQILENTAGRFIHVGMSEETLLTRVTLLILVAFLIKNVFDFLTSYFVVKLEQSVVRSLRTQVYDHLLELDLRFFNRTRAGDIIRRLTGDIDQMRLLLTNNLFKFITSVLQVVLAFAVLLGTNAKLTAVALIVLPVMFGVWGKLLRRLKRGDRSVLALSSDISSHIQETVYGARQVKAAAAEGFEARRFFDLTGRYFKAHVRTERVRALASPLSEMVGALGTVMILWYGARLVHVDETMSPQAFLVFLAFSMKLYQPAKWLSKFPSVVNPGLVSAERIFEFLDTPVEMPDRAGARPFEGFSKSLRFENVSFRYNADEPVLDDVSLEVKPGQVVALVGPSGAGKTTLADLVARFYDPVSGRITLDGVDLRDFQAKSYRARLGIVTQETVLFHDTVRHNIGYALEHVSEDAIRAAADAANATEFIERLPDGYDTMLGERATRLSGGQRQRVAIARAILRDPPILIFDEATSALDSESERLVQDAIERLLKGRTVFVIAHRLSTIRHADQILVMDRGRIIQRGTHDELIAQGGLYGKLHSLQFDMRTELPAGPAY